MVVAQQPTQSLAATHRPFTLPRRPRKQQNVALSLVVPTEYVVHARLAPCKQLCAGVLVVKSAEDGPRDDLPEPLGRTEQRRILGQSKMRPNVVVVGGVVLENTAQMVRALDHNVI